MSSLTPIADYYEQEHSVDSLIPRADYEPEHITRSASPHEDDLTGIPFDFLVPSADATLDDQHRQYLADIYSDLHTLSRRPLAKQIRELDTARHLLFYALSGLSSRYAARAKPIIPAAGREYRRFPPRMPIMATLIGLLRRGSCAAFGYLCATGTFHWLATRKTGPADFERFRRFTTIIAQELVSIEMFARARRIPFPDPCELDAAFAADYAAGEGPAAKLRLRFVDPDLVSGAAQRHEHMFVVPAYVPRPDEEWDAWASPRLTSTLAVDGLKLVTRDIMSKADWEDDDKPSNWPDNWPYPLDFKTRPTWAKCVVCNAPPGGPDCGCRLRQHKREHRPLVELREFGAQGVGVRALEEIPWDIILGPYTGEAIPIGSEGLDRSRYCYAFMRRGQELYQLDGYAFGCWTRWINHKCANGDVRFDSLVIGSRLGAYVISNRKIPAFQQITICYGEDHFGSGARGYCLCGEDECVQPPPKDDAGTSAPEVTAAAPEGPPKTWGSGGKEEMIAGKEAANNTFDELW